MGLNHDIEIWRRGNKQYDDLGNETQSYELFATYKGRFEFLSGNERRDNEETTFYTQRVIFDADIVVDTPDQIRFDNRQFQITSVYVRYDWDGTIHHKVAYLEEVI